MKILKVMAAAAAAILISAAPASAASVHLKGGANAEPSFYDGGLYLEATGLIAGLGNGDVVVTLTARGDVTATCTNPGSGAQQPPGQNPAEATLSGVQVIPDPGDKNGFTPFDVKTGTPTTPVPNAADCPNPNWVEDIEDVAFTSAVIRVYQPAGTLVLTVSCTFTEPTANGSVPSSNVTCSSS